VTAVGLLIALASQDFYRYETVFNVGTNWRVMDVVMLVLLVAAVLRMLTTRPAGPEPSFAGERAVFVTLALYAAVLAVAVLRGYGKVGTWALGVGRYSMLEIAYVPVLLAVVDSERRVVALLKALAWSLPVIWAAYFVAGLPQLDALLRGDPSARFTEAGTAFGLACVTVILFAVVMDPETRRNWFARFPLGSVVGGSLLMVLLVQHRSVWLATVGGLVAVVFLSVKAGGRRAMVRAALSVAGLLTIGLVVNDLIGGGSFLSNLARFRLGFLRGAEHDPTGYWRLRAWLLIAYRTWRANPLFGFGFSEAGWIDVSGKSVTVWEHNQYVHLFRATGLVGVGVYLAFLATCVRFAWKLVSAHGERGSRALAVGAFGVLAMNVVYMTLYNQVTFLWLAVGLLLVLGRLRVRQQRIPVSTTVGAVPDLASR